MHCEDDIGQSASWLMMDAAESLVNGDEDRKDGSDPQVCISSFFIYCTDIDGIF